MAGYTCDKRRIMEDEMNRFEEEIGLPNAPNAKILAPSVIGTNTFNQAQRKIHAINTIGETGDVVPPPPPPSLFIPHQVLQKSHTFAQDSDVIPPPLSPIIPPIGAAPRIANPSAVIPPPPPPPNLIFPPRLSHQLPYPFPNQQNNFGPIIPPTLQSTSSGRHIGPPRMPYYAPNPGYRNSYARNSSLSNSSAANERKARDTPVVLSATPKLYIAKPETTTTSSDSTENGDQNKNVPAAENTSKSNKKQKNIQKDEIKKNNISEAGPSAGKKKDKKSKKLIRTSGGATWEDPSLTEWEDGDFRLFCGDLGNDVTDELLTRMFSRYPSFLKARVVRDKRTNKTKGFGFISFKDPQDFIRATKEMNGRYVGSRPIKLRKSTWRNRNLDVVKKKDKEKAALIALLTGKS